jgi:hypothetical protein
MTPQSAKGKGAALQKWVRDKLMENAPELREGDCRSTSMGSGGEDVQLSPAAREIYPIQIECKNLAKIAVYGYYQQAMTHGPHEPVVIIKQNRSKPLALVDAEWFFKLLKGKNESKTDLDNP